MGKETREQMRRRFKMLARRWIFPPSEWEAQVVKEIQQLSEMRIPRASPEELAAAGMPAQHCHANARWYQDNDPLRVSRQITGWWRQEDVYVLHSVVEREGNMMCITPGPTDVDGMIGFIPDPELQWTESGQFQICMRNGQEVEFGVRADPETVIRRSKMLLAKLSAGGDPIKAARSIP